MSDKKLIFRLVAALNNPRSAMRVDYCAFIRRSMDRDTQPEYNEQKRLRFVVARP